MADRTRLKSARRWIILAALAGAIAGALALYAGSRETGKFASLAGGQCSEAGDLIRQVNAHARGAVAAMLPADPPRKLDNLTFDAPDGQTRSLANFRGKTVLLNLWAIWCPPCRAEMPALDQLQRDLGSDDFEVVAVSIDAGSDAKPKSFLDEIGVSSLEFYRDPSIQIFNDLKTEGLALGLPVTLLIGADGCLLGHMNGPADWASPDARRLIEAVQPTSLRDDD